jgi:hypothetical protein
VEGEEEGDVSRQEEMKHWEEAIREVDEAISACKTGADGSSDDDQSQHPPGGSPGRQEERECSTGDRGAAKFELIEGLLRMYVLLPKICCVFCRLHTLCSR